jgi:tetratricopeptide (TPR) repeat protein
MQFGFRICCCLLGTLPLAGTLRAQGTAIGERVVVVRDGAAIRAGDATIDVVDRGDILVVANSIPGLVLVGRGHSGWIAAADVAGLVAGLEQFNQLVARAPDDAGARAARAGIWVEQRCWDAALAESSEALRQNPQLPRAWLVRSAAQRGRRAFDAALADAEAAVRLSPASAVGYVARGDVWGAQGLHSRAVAEYSAALERDRNNAHILLRRAESRLHLSKPEEWQSAIEDLCAVIALSPHDPVCRRSAQSARGKAYMQQGDTRRALIEYTALLDENGEDVLALIGRGKAYGYSRQYDFALAAMDEAVYLEPKNPLVYIARAEIRTRQYNLAGALRDVDEAVRLDAATAETFRIRGDALARQRKWKAAADAFTQALALEPHNGSIFLSRALAFDALDNAESAQADRRRAAEIDPQFGHVAGPPNPGDDPVKTAAQRFSTLLRR